MFRSRGKGNWDGVNVMNKIKFGKCPTGRHKGESWEKLQNPEIGKVFTTARGYEWRKHNYYARERGHIFEVIEAGKTLGTARLVSVDHRIQLTKGEIWEDTFQDMNMIEWNNLLKFFYKRSDVAILWLVFRWEKIA